MNQVNVLVLVALRGHEFGGGGLYQGFQTREKNEPPEVFVVVECLKLPFEKR